MESTHEQGFYKVYHFIDTDRQFTSPQAIEQQPRIYVGDVFADGVEDAFKRTQNFTDSWAETSNVRSSCVGDVFIAPSGNAWLIKSMGVSLIKDFQTT